jgi:hypothetical protein
MLVLYRVDSLKKVVFEHRFFTSAFDLKSAVINVERHSTQTLMQSRFQKCGCVTIIHLHESQIGNIFGPLLSPVLSVRATSQATNAALVMEQHEFT